MSDPVLSISQADIYHEDCREGLLWTPDCSVDAVVTDPPYELGFMNKGWDASGIAFSVPLWREVLRVLKPGAHLLAFGGTRTYHRMTCAIEDAGFEIRDSLHWMYGTGFPKSLNLGDGRGTALKPGHEPIILARKPVEGTITANVAKWGTGALNIEGCRLGAPDPSSWTAKRTAIDTSDGRLGQKAANVAAMNAGLIKPPSGRWPANVLLDEAAAAELDEQTEGNLHSAGAARDGSTAVVAESYEATSFQLPPNRNMRRLGDSGGASRFFYVAKPSRKERDTGCEALPPRTAGEATDRDEGTEGLNNPRAGAGRTGGARNFHPTVKPVELMRYLCRLVTPPGGVVLDPFAGSGSTGMAALLEGLQFIGMEREAEYIPILVARILSAAKEREAA